MSESGSAAPTAAASAERGPRVPLRTVLREWGRIGCIGFGGPPAHIRLLRQLCVERRGWLDAREFEDAIAVCNLMPGPASTQLAIYCAWRLRGRLGALIGGAAFIVPGLIVILALAVLFVAGSPPLWVLGAGAGAGAAVPAVAVNAGWSLLGPSWRNRGATIRWLIYLAAGLAAAAVIGAWLVLVLLGCGTIELAARSAARPGAGADAPGLRGVLAAPVVLAVGGGVLASVAWEAFKVGGLSFGGGFVIIPLMQADAVSHYHWMTGAQFLNAVALGQITPGPVVQTVAVVGYAAAGIAGGLLASAVAFTPSFLLVLFGGPRFEQIRGNQRARAFLDGAGPAAIGAILGSAITLTRALTHPWQYAVLAGALVVLLPLRRGVVLTLLAAAAIGTMIALAAGTVSPLPPGRQRRAREPGLDRARRPGAHGLPFRPPPAWPGEGGRVYAAQIAFRGGGRVAMARIVIVGAGVVGLGAGLLLCRDGHEVTILERDAQPPPAGAEEIWGTWQRKGVNQFRLPHFFLARYRGLLDSELPEVKEELVAAGAVRPNPVRDVPEAIRGPVREEDGAFECISGRRCVVEAAVASVAGRTPHLEIRRGAAVAGLVTGPSAHDGVPHVAGVRLGTGEEIAADLVVDMTGRRSPLPRWLEAIGSRPPHDELDDCGFIYYGRHFHSPGGIPPALGGFLMHLGTISSLTLPADNGTWSVTLVASAKDKALRRLSDAAIWEKAVRSLPLVAHWLDGQPIDDRVIAMAGIEDRHRNLMIDGAPVATGVVAAGDAWACSNPTVGRGASIGMLQAVLLRDTIAATGLDDPWEFACSFHLATAEMVEPWYRDTLAADRHRLAEIDALIGGDQYRPGDPGWEIGQAFGAAAAQDPDCLRGFLTVAMVLGRAADVVARPGLLDKVIALGGGWRDEPLPAPSRARLLSIVAGD